MTAPASDRDDPRLAEPGVMRAIWWSVCRACDEIVHGAGVCGCGQTHPRGEVQALAQVPGQRRCWVHVACRDRLAAQPSPLVRGARP